jgi:hypothetical protein
MKLWSAIMTNGKTAVAFPELNALLEDYPEISLTDLGNIFQVQ